MNRFFLLFICLFSAQLLAQFPGCPDVDAGIDQTTPCPNTCVTLNAQPIVSGLTTSYTVSAVDYAPPIAYNAPGGTPISVATDDVWSPVVQLPFNFCYYGQTYTACQVGSNGAIRMGNGGLGTHPWQFNNPVPSNALIPAGNIFGIYHDIDPAVAVPGGGIVQWYLLGTAPCRIFVVSFFEMAHFSCNNLRSTHMMVLYETTNVIDVYVEKKQTCNNWNGGRAVIGIQNVNGSQGIAAPNRNTGPWTVVVPEAWRFSPAGTPTYTVSWFEGNQLISNNATVQVCPNANTTYTASVTYTPCAGGVPVTVTDDVNVIVNPGVVPSFAPVNTTYCIGSTIPSFPNTSQNGVTGTWSPAINNQQTTTYTFTPSANQCASTVQTTINITPIQTPTFSFPLGYCQGQNIPNLPSTSNNGIQGQWTPAVNNQQTTTYSFTPNQGQCAAPIQSTITITPYEVPVFNNIGPFCAGDFIPNLPTTSLNNFPGVWTPAINNQQTTTYTFVPDLAACAIGNGQMTIEVFNNILPIFDPYPAYCIDDLVPNFPTISNNNINGFWSPAINNQQTTNYIFTPTDAGCFVNANMTVEIINTVESLTIESRCENNLPLFWNGMTLIQSGLYEAYFVSSLGCDSIAKIQFTVIPKVESMTIITVCDNELPLIWNGLSVTETGSYNVVLTSSLGCDSIAYLSAHVRQAPNVSFVADITESCGSINPKFTITSTDPYVEAHWNFGNGSTSNQLGQTSHFYNTTGCFDVTLSLTNQFGCSAQLQQTEMICVFPNPVASFVINPSALDAYNQTAKFINLSTQADSYFWSFGFGNATSTSTSPIYNYPDTPGQYQVWLIAENDFGCVDSTTQFVNVVIEPVYYIPNTFTPDGDQYNNVFLPVFSSGFDPFNFEMLIFDRWGEVLFESKNALIGWDGTYGGKMMQDGTYLYKIAFRDMYSDKRYEVTGHVNLIR